MSDKCVFCKKFVTYRQEALQCDGCQLWQHRTCQTGISRSLYRKLVTNQEELENWICFNCKKKKVSIIEIFGLRQTAYFPNIGTG